MNFFKKTKKKATKTSNKEVITNTKAIVGGTDIVPIRTPRYKGSRG